MSSPSPTFRSLHPERDPEKSLSPHESLLPRSPTPSITHQTQQSPRQLVDNSRIHSIKSFAAAWPSFVTAKADRNGQELLCENLLMFFVGILQALLLCFWIWLLPSWAKFLFICWSSYGRVNRLQGMMLSLGYADRICSIVSYAVAGIWFAISWSGGVWGGEELDMMLVEQWNEKAVAPLVMSWVNFVLADGAARMEDIRLTVDANFAMGYAMTVLLVQRPTWLMKGVWEMGPGWLIGMLRGGDVLARYYLEFQMSVASATWVFKWVLLPLLVLLGVLWILSDPDAGWKSMMRSIVGEQVGPLWLSMALFFISIYEGYAILAAWLCAYLPEVVQASVLDFKDRRTRDTGREYRYQSLRPGQFRVLVLGRSWPGIIKSQLITASSPSDVDYEVISYRCHDPTTTTNIWINGERITIPRSAAKALLIRCSMWYSRVVWIDAVCIDQSNAEERDQQMRMTRDICHSATRVIAIPDVSWRSRLATELLYRHSSKPTPEPAATEALALNADAMMYGLAICPTHLYEVRDLMNASYWTRSWILQELCCGEKVDVYLGGLFVPFETFTRGQMAMSGPLPIMFMGKSAAKTLSILSNIERLGRLDTRRLDFAHVISRPSPSTSELNTDFETCLRTVTESRSQDEPSRIQAMRVMTSHFLDPSFPTSSLPKVPSHPFQSLALSFYLSPNSPSLRLLSFSGTGFTDGPPARLPASWVPNLNYTSRTPFFDPFDRPSSSFDFRASGSSKPHVTLHPSLPDALLFRARTLDAISALTPASTPPFPTLRDLPSSPLPFSSLRANMVGWVHAAVALVGGSEMYPGLGAALAAEMVTSPAQDAVLGKWLEAYGVDVDELTELARRDPGKGRELEDARFKQLDVETLKYACALLESSGGRRFGLTAQGRMCLVPPRTEVGDEVAVVWGADVLFVVRRVVGDGEKEGAEGEERRYEIVGEAYVDGIMRGEGVRDGEDVEDLVVV